jgi:hypothetical protein
MNRLSIAIVLVLASGVLMASQIIGPAGQELPFHGPFLGQDPPGLTPEVFAEGFFSAYAPVHGRITFNPEGTELYWTANAAPVQSRWHMVMREDGSWTLPEPSWLDLAYMENGLSFDTDGGRAWFHSDRPAPAGGGAGDANLWYRERVEGGWGDPVALGTSVNTAAAGERQPTLPRDGTLYFTREPGRSSPGESWYGASDLFVAHPVEGGFGEAERLGPEINSPYHEVEAAVAPDHSYLVFISNRPGGYSERINLYVSFRREDGSWTHAMSLSDVFELDNIWFPSITPDGRYLFFCDAHYTPDGIVGEYYWVDTRAVEHLRPARRP